MRYTIGCVCNTPKSDYKSQLSTSSSMSPLSVVSSVFTSADFTLFWCVFMCFDRWSDRVNRLPHSWQAKRFSPVCVLRWRWSSSDRVKDLLQKSQLQTKGRSPACHRRCALRWLVLPYTFPQPAIWHTCCFGLFGSDGWPDTQFGHLHRRQRRVTPTCWEVMTCVGAICAVSCV